MTVSHVDTSSRILFLPRYHSRLQNLATGMVIPAKSYILSKAYTVEHSMEGIVIHLQITTFDQQQIGFTNVFNPTLLGDKCEGHILGRSVEISDRTHYSLSHHQHHGHPAIVDVKLSGPI